MRPDQPAFLATPGADPFAVQARPEGPPLEPGWLVEIPAESEPAARPAPTPASAPRDAAGQAVRPAARRDGRPRPAGVVALARAARARFEDPALRQKLARRLGARPARRAAAVAGTRPNVPAYPLGGAPWLRGLSPAQHRFLVHDFRTHTPRPDWGSAAAAWAHLGGLVNVWPLASWEALHGVHVVLGAAGSGKTTLVLKAARQLLDSGRSAAVLALFPRQQLQAAAFRSAAALAGVPAGVVSTPAGWTRARAGLAQCDVVLVDTPCCLSEPQVLEELLALPDLRRAGSALHYAVCLHHGADFLARQLRGAARLEIDFLALSQVDLAPGLGALLELQARPPVSFVNAAPRLDVPLVFPSTERVLEALGCRPAD